MGLKSPASIRQMSLFSLLRYDIQWGSGAECIQISQARLRQQQYEGEKVRGGGGYRVGGVNLDVARPFLRKLSLYKALYNHV